MCREWKWFLILMLYVLMFWMGVVFIVLGISVRFFSLGKL